MYEAKKTYSFFSASIFRQDLRRSKTRLIRYGIVTAFLLCFFFLLYPALASGHLRDMLLFSFLPSTVGDILKLEWLDQIRDFQFYFPFAVQFITMLGCVFAAMQGLTALVREQEDGTIEFIYSLPVSRLGIFLSKFFSRLITLLLLNVWCAGVTAALCMVAAPEGVLWVNWIGQIYGYSLLAQLIFLGFGYCLSTLIHDITTTTSIAFGAFLATYLCGLLASMFETLRWLRFFSPYHLANPVNVVETGFAIEIPHLFFMLAFFLFCMLGGCLRFWKKEFFCR